MVDAVLRSQLLFAYTFSLRVFAVFGISECPWSRLDLTLSLKDSKMGRRCHDPLSMGLPVATKCKPLR